MHDLFGLMGIPPEPADGPATVIAFVGAGGKTSAMFALAEAARLYRTIITTTTMMFDPRFEPGRRFGRVSTMRVSTMRVSTAYASTTIEALGPGDPPLVLASEFLPETRKIRGIHPSRVPELGAFCDLVLVEADGARGRSVKAPAAHEPMIPPCADIVAGLVGLDCLGRPMDETNVHRPELFGAVTSCAPGEAIAPRHILALVRAQEGLYKNVPPGAERILLLNKTDAADPVLAAELCALMAGEIKTIVCSIRKNLFFAGAECIDASSMRSRFPEVSR
ncbi:MAG: selenium cofactor biosynthesis protein YqeC [Rectinemataceae bacterium]